MFKEQIQSFLDHKILMHELKKDFKDFECYKQGIIDERGNKIKQPVTEEEKNAFSPMTKTLIRLKKFIGSKLDLIEATESLSSGTKLYKEDIEYYKKTLVHQHKVVEVINQLYTVLDEAYEDGVAVEDIKKLIDV